MSQDKAERYNKGKPEYSLLDFQCLKPCVDVLSFGAKKYSRDNWKNGMPREQIFDSLLRHIGALLGGEELDPESGLSHIGHIQANALFLGNKNNTTALSDHVVTESMGLYESIKDVDLTGYLETPVSFKEYDAFVEALADVRKSFGGLCAPSSYDNFNPVNKAIDAYYQNREIDNIEEECDDHH